MVRLVSDPIDVALCRNPIIDTEHGMLLTVQKHAYLNATQCGGCYSLTAGPTSGLPCPFNSFMDLPTSFAVRRHASYNT
jgi:hypothetical protein